MKYRLLQIVFVRYFLAILLYLPAIAFAQDKKKYPQNYFRWPLNLKPEIVANMGELRSNHWHMGLDIRTDQKVDQLVYAAAEGYIAYVGIRASSYGRFIIINHPNGLSTLYGHLNDFNPVLEKYVTEQQYKEESWPVELTIPKDKFPVNKGSFIAYSGTTGGSQGPHVHFEIRDTKTDKCLNPLLFGMPLQDNVKPGMVKLAMYDRNYSVYEQSPKFFALKNTDSGYIIPKMPVVKTASQNTSFSLQLFDRMTGSNNQDGVYSAKLFLDNIPQVEFVIDSIDYNITVYINAQIDYKYNANGGAYMQHLSKMPGDNGGVYHIINGNGVLQLADTNTHAVKVEVKDSYGNSCYLNFKVQYDPKAEKINAGRTSKTIFPPGNINVLEKPDFEAFLPENALYDSIIPFYYRSNSNIPSSVSAIHQLNDESYPVHGNITVRIKPDKIIPDSWKNKLVIKRTYRNSASVKKAQWQGDWLSADFGDFGYFQAFADTEPPILPEIGKGDTVDLSPASRIIITPTDNFGIKNFRAELDGQWLRFTNDKSRSWIYIFDERCPDGVHELKVRVEDIVGNVTTKTWLFKKYPYTAPKKKAKAPVRKKVTVKKKTTKKK
ncbi:MAG: peptidoglycan DD-metalloendopeptidase family protein [Chitinophagaceae bacterium]